MSVYNNKKGIGNDGKRKLETDPHHRNNKKQEMMINKNKIATLFDAIWIEYTAATAPNIVHRSKTKEN